MNYGGGVIVAILTPNLVANIPQSHNFFILIYAYKAGSKWLILADTCFITGSNAVQRQLLNAVFEAFLTSSGRLGTPFVRNFSMWRRKYGSSLV